MSYKNWTSEEDALLENLAETNKLSYLQIGEKLGRSGLSCQSRASRLGIKNLFNRTSNKKYNVNENFWSVISQETCYWAGFSAADASVQNTTSGSFEYSLELKQNDENHIVKLKELCGFTGKIFRYTRKNGTNPTSKMRINSEKWLKDLRENFGITPRKVTTIMPPRISDRNLLTRWLIGYTDGDGCISLAKGGKIPYLSYVSRNQQLINWIKDYFDNFGVKLKNKSSVVQNHNGKYFTFSIGGLKAAQFINFVNDLGIYCLARKWKNVEILNIVKNYKEKYSKYFQTSAYNK